jgi:large subunit ribosomal protein L23
MALFGKKKEVKEEKVVTAKAATPGLATGHNIHSVLLKPHFTEKSVKMGEVNVYTFEVKRDASKHAIAAAVKALYNVTPVKVNTVTKLPAKRLKGSSGRMVKQPGMKKAYVYLKKGDTITLV